MIKHLLATATAVLIASSTLAAPISFDFRDPKGVNNVAFHLDAPLESQSGTANGVSGTVVFDPANPAATTGKIAVTSASLTLPNATMREHLHSPGWIDVAQHPEITFELSRLANVSTTGTETTAEATGRLTIKGITREITAPVRISYLEGALSRRQPNAQGDLLVIRSDFAINRDDYGIRPGQNLDTVGTEIRLSLAIAGVAPRG